MKKRRIQGKLSAKDVMQARKSMHRKRKMLSVEDAGLQRPSLIARIFSWFLALFFTTQQNKDYSREIEQLQDQIAALETTVAKLTKSVTKLQKRTSSSSVAPIVAPTAGFIPPPPPMAVPPPPPLLAKPIQFNKVSSTVPDKKAKVTNQGVSLLDLKSVKLKKRNPDSENNTKTKPTSKMQLVTLKDLQNVKLKKRDTKSDENKNFHSPKSAPNKVKALRKTNIIRSPGGTPLVARNAADTTGEGLTPAFTKALRRKFESIRTSPLEKSPIQWRC